MEFYRAPGISAGVRSCGAMDLIESETESGTSMVFKFSLSCFVAGSCLLCIGLNLIPALVTLLILAWFVCACRVCVPQPRTQVDEEQPAHRKQVWASTTLPRINTSHRDFHLVQFERSGLNRELSKQVLCPVSVPRARGLWHGEPTCVCCLDDFTPKDTLAVLPCGHVFHEECVMKWFLADASAGACPMCRARVVHYISPSRKVDM